MKCDACDSKDCPQRFNSIGDHAIDVVRELRRERDEALAEADRLRKENRPSQDNEREQWLLSEVGSLGRRQIQVEQYEELRCLAVKLAKRLVDAQRDPYTDWKAVANFTKQDLAKANTEVERVRAAYDEALAQAHKNKQWAESLAEEGLRFQEQLEQSRHHLTVIRNLLGLPAGTSANNIVTAVREIRSERDVACENKREERGRVLQYLRDAAELIRNNANNTQHAVEYRDRLNEAARTIGRLANDIETGKHLPRAHK